MKLITNIFDIYFTENSPESSMIPEGESQEPAKTDKLVGPYSDLTPDEKSKHYLAKNSSDKNVLKTQRTSTMPYASRPLGMYLHIQYLWQLMKLFKIN